MAKQGINTGSSPNDGSGDTLLAGAQKINSNFDEIYDIIGDGTNAFVGVVTEINAGNNISISTAYGAVTVTGTAQTAETRSNTLVVSGVSTLGTLGITGLTTTRLLTVTGLSTFTNQLKIESNDSTPGRIDFYCESSNAHYTRVQAPPHATYSGNNTITLPVSTGTLLNTDGDGSSLMEL